MTETPGPIENEIIQVFKMTDFAIYVSGFYASDLLWLPTLYATGCYVIRFTICVLRYLKPTNPVGHEYVNPLR